MSSNKLLNKINKFLDKITEPVPEITDNGLNEDFVEPITSVPTPKSVEIKEDIPTKEPKKLFGKIKSQESVSTAVEPTESSSNLTQLLKTTPDTVAETPVYEAKETVTNVKMDTFPVYNEIATKEEMTKEELFEYNLKVGDELIEGFSDTCYDTIEGIQSHPVLSQERKEEKITNIEKEFLSISRDDKDSMIIFFKIMYHELHMIKNNLGEYDERVYVNNLISDPRVRNYNIVELHMSDDLYQYESREDKDSINKLLDMCEEIHKRANTCNCLNDYLSKTEALIMSCSTILDIANVEEKFEGMLMDLNVKINTSSDNRSTLAQ